MTSPRFEVDLRDRGALARALDQYLSMGVCPVHSREFPGALVEVQLDVLLPDGSRLGTGGRVIQQMGSALFLVQLAGPVDLVGMRKLVEAPAEETEAAEPVGDEPLPELEEGLAEAEAQDEPGDADDRPDRERGASGEGSSVTGYESDMSDVYSQMADLSVQEKRRLARYGNKTVRQLLMRDPNKSLHVLVMKNPKMGMDEALEYSKRPNISPEALKTIAENRTWMNSKQLIFNLVRNPSTPLDLAVRLMSKLTHHEWRILARSSSVRMPVTAAARKLLLQKMGG
jgi:hypothetical protein